MKIPVLLLLLFFACAASYAQEIDRTMALWDSTLTMPPGWPEGNPYTILYQFYCDKTPVLDHTGKPHHNGHVVQVIMDGGNNIQDPPKADGSPGGDDSMAFGNFNMISILGLSGIDDWESSSGQFYSKKAFIPVEPNRAYYLRVWEGDNVKTAPYYNDSIEYRADDDRGGAMLRLKSGYPHDVDFTFGPAKARPEAPKAEKKKVSKKK